jgi:acyl-CoA synthetase (AMP-forming)/AMP-acid ligase II/NADP-dependent 3-hydroxy acid dehydrogenase YdfG
MFDRAQGNGDMSERSTPASTIVAMLETRLLAAPGVIEAHMVARDGEDGVRLVAYVAGGQRDVLEAAMAGMEHVALVRVPALPLRADGSVDEDALTALPAWTGASMQAALHGQAPSATIFRAAVPTRGRLHLADMLPDYPLLTSSVAETVSAKTAEAPAAGKPAICRSAVLSAMPGMPATLAAALEHAARDPALGVIHVAADMSETRVSYAELFEQARRLQGGLFQQNVRQGDVVLVDSTDSRCLLPLFWACVLGGLVPAPFKLAAAAAGGAQLKRLRDSWEVLGRPFIAADAATLRLLAPLGAEALSGMRLLDAAELCLAESAVPTPAADVHALSMVFMTSGSTGLPKGVMLSQANVLAMIGGMRELGTALAPGATTMNWMPLDHVGAVGFLSVLPLVLGMNQVQVDTATVLAAPTRWLDLVHRHRICAVWTPNFAFDVLLQAASQPGAQQDWDLSSLRMLINGGEAVSDSVLTAFATRFAENGLPAGAIHPSFGMTETVSAFSMSQWVPGNGAVVSLGTPIPGCAQRIVDEQGELVSEGTIGSVELAGASLFMGYFGRPDLTAAAMHGDWFRSGDMGFLRNGELFVMGRTKEMIIVNGANFYSNEIEELVAQVDGIDRLGVAAIGVRAPAARTDQLALVFHAPDASDDAALRRVMQDIRMLLGRQMSLMPEYFIAVPADRLPRTSSGKVQRVELKRLTEAGAFDTEIKHAACLLAAAGTIPSWFSEPFWKPCASRAGVSAQGMSVAVFGDTSPADAALREAFAEAAPDIRWRQIELGQVTERLGEHVWRIDGRHADDADPLPHLTSLLDSMGQQAAVPDVLLVLPSQARLPHLLLLCQALAKATPGIRPARLIVCGAAEDIPEHAAAAAFLRTSAAEIGGVHCLHIQFQGKGLQADVGMILDDLRRNTRETELAYIDGRRHIRRWREVVPRKAAHPEFRAHGLYLISGGLGGVGLLLARHLIDRYQAHVLIVGRTPTAQLDETRAQALRELERGGRVAYACADVADIETLRTAVAQVRARWQRDLDGVLHLAGEGRQTELRRETAATLARMLHAKVEGSRALHALIETNPEAWFILVGSVTGMVAGSQDAAYAAANAFQAAMVEQLSAAGNARCRYLGFSAWRDTGLSKGGVRAATLEAVGFFSLEPESAVASFEIALSTPGPLLAIGLDLSHSRHAPLRDAIATVDEPVLFQTGAHSSNRMVLRDSLGRALSVPVIGLDVMPRDSAGAIDRFQLARIAGGLAQPGLPSNEFERYMVQLWCLILEISTCGVHDDFFALGGNSLRAAQIAAYSRERLRLDVGMPDLLLNPTVAGFCSHVRGGESKPGITEAIARRLLEIERMTPEQKAARIAARAS